MKVDKKILLIVITAVVIYAIFLLIADFNTIQNQLSKFDTRSIPIILALMSSVWLVLFFRWNLLLKTQGINLPLSKHFLIFLASLSFIITPGKVGELIKSQFLKSNFDVPLKKTAPLILVEKFYSAVGAIIVSIIGIWSLDIAPIVIGISSITLITIFIIFSSRSLFNKGINLLNRIKYVEKHTSKLTTSYEVVRCSTRGKMFPIFLSLSIVAWLLEAFAVYIILISFGIDSLPYLTVLSTYAISQIIGFASFIPGGIGIAEGSFAGLLSLYGIELTTALGLAIFIRLFTLWYTVSIGFIALKKIGISNGLDKKD